MAERSPCEASTRNYSTLLRETHGVVLVRGVISMNICLLAEKIINLSTRVWVLMSFVSLRQINFSGKTGTHFKAAASWIFMYQWDWFRLGSKRSSYLTVHESGISHGMLWGYSFLFLTGDKKDSWLQIFFVVLVQNHARVFLIFVYGRDCKEGDMRGCWLVAALVALYAWCPNSV